MPFLQLTLDVGAADPAPFEDALLAAGAISITLLDAADDPVLEPAPGTTPLWPTVRVRALFEGDTDADAVMASLASELPAPLPKLTAELLADRAWEREWLKDFRPMRFGRRLWICPGGQRPQEVNGGRGTADGEEDREPCSSEPQPAASSLQPAVFIDLDPGLAFGTGTHPTTALCLEWLDGAALRGKRVIDFGCGSGVLAIAALKLGAASALAVDIDPQALIATVDNAQRNGVAEHLQVQSVDSMPRVPADIVLANILAEPLEQLADCLARLVVPGGHLVLSGLLRDQAARVAMRYAPWFDIGPVTIRDDWARLDGVRRA